MESKTGHVPTQFFAAPVPTAILKIMGARTLITTSLNQTVKQWGAALYNNMSTPTQTHTRVKKKRERTTCHTQMPEIAQKLTLAQD